MSIVVFVSISTIDVMSIFQLFLIFQRMIRSVMYRVLGIVVEEGAASMVNHGGVPLSAIAINI